MSYSLDLRQKVITYLENGGSITKAAKILGIGRATIYRWLNRQNLEPTKVERRQRKLDWKALEKDVQENPDAKLIERAKKFGVHPTAIWYALNKIQITRKKKELRYRERNREERIKYYRILRELIKMYGSESLVFIDESGFEDIQSCIYGWSKKGKKVYGEKQGKRGTRENLVAGRRKKEKDLIAPMLFRGSLNADGMIGWLVKYLLPELKIISILIMDNAPIHRKNVIRDLVESAGHKVLFLPKYSPDLNDIEHDFSALKRARMYAPVGTSLDEVIRDYCAI
ncbi:MAG: IS630 family transposase [Hormoscilla sp. GM7CHS1pb]|nr:IS630 family transposase [Hormoscilla sp. GM7CHS1pb]MBC6480402.1 IS630 family transposase [Hormoscilla sp. GM7CHS1pb]